MARLRHSAGAMVRTITMSSADVTAFVEGLIDRPFFSNLISAVPESGGKVTQIRLAHEIDSQFGNGKTALLQVHQLLKRRKKLAFTGSKGDKTVIVFLDKDIDDLRRVKRRCPHIVYTDYYSVENYLYRHGCLPTAIANGALLDRFSTASIPRDGTWAATAASKWSRWVAFCLMVSRLKIEGLPNFGVSSKFNATAYGASDPIRESTLLTAAANRSNKTLTEVRAKFAKSIDTVREYLLEGTIDRLFNGKWYAHFVSEEAQRLATGRQLAGDISERIESALLTTLQFNEAWAGPMRDAVARLLRSRGISSSELP